MVIASGNCQSGPLGQTLQPFVVTLKDKYSNAVLPGSPVSFKAGEGCFLPLSSDLCVGAVYQTPTDSQGQARVTYQITSRNADYGPDDVPATAGALTAIFKINAQPCP
jgi:hypothetical protein